MASDFTEKASAFTSRGVNIYCAFISGAKKLCQIIHKVYLRYIVQQNGLISAAHLIMLLVSAKLFIDLISCAVLEHTFTFGFY